MINVNKKETPNQYELWGAVEAIVLHTTLGAYEGAVDWLTTIKSNSSAHFVIGRNGEITQLAELSKGTWHAGGVSNPSPRAKAILPKKLWGALKNPNRYTIGIEFASGYDIDKDGVLESWEKLYTPAQVKACAELIKTVIDIRLAKKFRGARILTHRDIASYKPDLEIQRAMILSELAKLDKPIVAPAEPVEEKPEQSMVQLEVGNRYEVLLNKEKFIDFKEITS